ncbi:hypothetical protein THOD04_50035 [Vibrio owensii]|nr:hypothetical protein THOD04_50035 [Vibrio owensii]
MVKEIPDDAPSSLSGMTPFDLRVTERHPQERGTNELGIFYSLSHLGVKCSSGRNPFPPISALRTKKSRP